MHELSTAVRSTQKTLALLALLYSASAASTAPAWLILENPYFTAYTTASESRALELMQELDRFREAVQLVTDLRIPEGARRTDVLILGEEFASVQYSQRTAGFAITLPPDTAGRQGNLIVIPASKPDVNEKVQIRHEYVHVLNSYRPLRYPTWFEEGSAEVFAYTTISDDNTIVIDVPSDRIRWFNRAAAVGLDTWMSLDRIVSEQLRPRGTLRHTYLQYWLLTHYLVFGNPTLAPQLERSILYFDAGMPPLEAFTKSFGMTPEELWDKEISHYVRRIKSARYALREPITGHPFSSRSDTSNAGEAMIQTILAQRKQSEAPR